MTDPPQRVRRWSEFAKKLFLAVVVTLAGGGLFLLFTVPSRFGPGAG